MGDNACEIKEIKHNGIIAAMNRLDGAVERLSNLIIRAAEGQVPPKTAKEPGDLSNTASLGQFLASTKGRIDEQVGRINEKVKELEEILF